MDKLLLENARMFGEMIREAFELAQSERYDDLVRSSYLLENVIKRNEDIDYSVN